MYMLLVLLVVLSKKYASNIRRLLLLGCNITSDVLEHKWRASLKTILFYMNDFDF